MNENHSIACHSEALLRIVMDLFAKIGLAEGGMIDRVPRPLYRTVLGILRPAESAVRRLIIVMARNIVVTPRPKRPFPRERVIARREKGASRREALFRLFDPPRRSGRNLARSRRHKGRRIEPRVYVIGDFYPGIPWFLRGQAAPQAPAPTKEEAVEDDTVSAIPLCRRLFAILRALQDMPRQAERYARRRDRPKEEGRRRGSTALRIGRPPGFRQKQIHEVDEILAECHYLAQRVQMADTS